MGHKRRLTPVRVELDLHLRGVATVVLEEAVVDRLARRLMRETISLAELGVAVDWADVARHGDGGFVVGVEPMGKLS
jgi:hypothetical protein